MTSAEDFKIRTLTVIPLERQIVMAEERNGTYSLDASIEILKIPVSIRSIQDMIP